MPRSTMPSLARPALVAVTVLALIAAFFVASPSAQAAPSDPSLKTRDYTADGKTDVLTVNSAGQLALYAGNGRSGWAPAALAGGGWGGFTLVTPGDFNGDGRSDLLAVSPDGRLYFYAGRGNGFAGRVQVGHGWGGMSQVFSPGDFTGDGKPDIVATTTSGDMYLYHGTGTGRIGASAKIGFGWQGFTDIVGGGDFNGDGRADIFARDAAGRLFAYYGKGNGTMSARVQIGNGWGSYSQLGAVGDFTGDGHTDFLAVHTPTGEAYIYPGTGRGTFGARILLGADWQRPGTSTASSDFTYERTWLRQSLNTLRADRGLAPVARSAELDARAQAWAQHMAQTQNMYHTPGFREQMTAAGWSYKSELIVRNTGGRTMETSSILTYMHNWWVASPNHYPWMVSPNYTHVGHGYFMGPRGPYAVTVLGGR